MKKSVCVFVIFLFLHGCSFLPEPTPAEKKIELPGTSILKEREIPPALENVEDQALREYTLKKGVVFAKTVFEGVLETSYVKLRFEGQGKDMRSFYLHIEDNPGERPLLWNDKTVKPGYFFIELPAGFYKISSIAIPVGSTLAEEDIHISFDVIPGSVCYIGTLRVVGTKEKIKLGGVPVIKPGFEYEVEVLDEREEGFFAFHSRYPNVPVELCAQLMRLTP